MRPKTGSIDTTSTGRSRVRITLPTGDRKTLGIYDTEDEARGELEAALLVLSTESATDGWSVLKWGERWLTAREVGRVVRDPASDWGRFNQHIKGDPIAKMGLRAVRRRHVRDWLKRVRSKVARQTALNTLNVMRGMFAAAVDDEILKANPAAGLRLPREKRTQVPWTYAVPSEQAALVDAVEGEERHLVAFAIGSGLRAGELCTLRIADVHVTGASPHVVVRYGSVPAEPTKTGRIRTVPLFGLALEAAKAWLAILPRWAKKNPHKLMFPRLRGGFRDERHVIRWEDWTSAKKRAGITRRFRFHDLRHTAASSLVSGWWGRQWSLTEVRDFLGHESVTTTERYAHLAGTALERAAAETNRRLLAISPTTNGHHNGVLRLPKPGVTSSNLVGDASRILGVSVDAATKDRGQLVATSIAFLRAVASGDEVATTALQAQLGALFVADLTRAIELAEALVAQANAVARNAAGDQ